MEDLRKSFEGMGFKNVRTLIASGNVLFETSASDSGKLAQKIEAGLKKSFGFPVDVILRSLEEIQRILISNPFKDIKVTPEIRLYVSFLTDKPKTPLKLPYESPQKDFRILRTSEREVFSVSMPAPRGRSTGNLMTTIEKAFGKKITTRNWNTIARILS